MSQRAQIAASVMAAFEAIGDIARNLSFVRVTGPAVLDVETGASVLPTATFPVPKAVFARMKVDELGNDIAAQQDQKIIFPMAYIGGDTYEYRESDYILDRAGRRWEIIRYMGEPSGTVFIAQVRD